MNRDNYIDINKNLWNQRVEHHVYSEFYDLEAFLKGKNSLNSIELELLGDMRGKKILHLMCHFGQDSLSLARMGAQVTGVDFSEKAISKARELNEVLGLTAKFIESEVYSFFEKCNETFDLVFMSYGVIGWLPDIPKLFQLLNQHLNTGGQFVLAEFHPVVWMFDDDFQEVAYRYDSEEAIVEEITGSYTDQQSDIKAMYCGWNHGLGTVLSSLIAMHFELESFEEYDYSPYSCFKGAVEVSKGKYQIKGLEAKLPMVYALKAKKK
jgi:SAM-dependent methyltransferase